MNNRIESNRIESSLSGLGFYRWFESIFGPCVEWVDQCRALRACRSFVDLAIQGAPSHSLALISHHSLFLQVRASWRGKSLPPSLDTAIDRYRHLHSSIELCSTIATSWRLRRASRGDGARSCAPLCRDGSLGGSTGGVCNLIEGTTSVIVPRRGSLDELCPRSRSPICGWKWPSRPSS